MEERKLVDIEEVKDVLGDTINSEGDYRHALRLLDGLNTTTEQEIVKPYLEKIRARIELEKLGYPPSAGYYKAIMKCLQIIDKYKAESEGE